jgi:ArsR family transcriptional regulator, arsenate/arsenite/antimonite-responsive transcriptional repressor
MGGIAMEPADLFKALADETRLRLLNILNNGDLCVCELETILNLSQPNASRHLKALKNAGLVGTHRAGQWIHYWIHPDFCQGQNEMWNALMTFLESSRGIYHLDQQRYEMYKERGWTCQDLKHERNKIGAELHAGNQ